MIHPISLAKVNLTMETGTIARWLKMEGDPIVQDETLYEVESDKSVVEAPSFYTGILLKIVVPVGQEVPVGTIVAYVGEEGDVWSDQ